MVWVTNSLPSSMPENQRASFWASLTIIGRPVWATEPANPVPIGSRWPTRPPLVGPRATRNSNSPTLPVTSKKAPASVSKRAIALSKINSNSSTKSKVAVSELITSFNVCSWVARSLSFSLACQRSRAIATRSEKTMKSCCCRSKKRRPGWRWYVCMAPRVSAPAFKGAHIQDKSSSSETTI